MLQEFEKYAGIKILKFFLLNPKIEMHIKEVAKKLKVSPSTAKFYCDLFLKEDIFVLEVKGNLRIFSLNNASPYVKELKKTFALLYFKKFDLGKIVKKGRISLAIYGSYATGEFDERSDIDLIAIGEEKDIDKNFVLALENKIGRKIQLTTIRYHKWEKLKKVKDPFTLEVLANHILIKGSIL